MSDYLPSEHVKELHRALVSVWEKVGLPYLHVDRIDGEVDSVWFHDRRGGAEVRLDLIHKINLFDGSAEVIFWNAEGLSVWWPAEKVIVHDV